MAGEPPAPAGKLRRVASCLLAAGLLFSLASRPSPAQDTFGASTESLEEEDEEFADWEDEEEEASSLAPARQEIVLEFRATDVFDEPSEPTVGPPPDGVYFLSDEITVAPGKVLKIEGEYLRYDDEEIADRGRLLVLWEPTLRSGAYLDFDAAHLWDEEGETGFAAGVAVGWQAGPNMDLYARVGGSKSVTGTWGGGASGKLTAALGRFTALQARASYYRDENRETSGRGELELAQYLGRRTGLHLLVRSNRSTIEDVGFEDTNSTVASVGLRHVFAERTLLRGAFRWYSDTAGVRATGVSLGVEQSFARGSAGAYYRYYVSNEEVKAGTWWVTAKLLF